MNTPDKDKKTRGARAQAKPAYHHGNLREALLASGELVLRRDGVAGLGMRAVAREAGVSHTAAKPHFGDLDGFRAELAAVGYRRLAAAVEATAGITPPRAQRVARARAYITFAEEHTELFNLMFRKELVDMQHPALVEASALAMRGLVGPLVPGANPEQLSRDAAIRATAAWAYVHGLAVLLVEKRLRGVQKRAPDFPGLTELVVAVLESVTLVVEPR